MQSRFIYKETSSTTSTAAESSGGRKNRHALNMVGAADFDFTFTQLADIPLDVQLDWQPPNPRVALYCHESLSYALVAGRTSWYCVDFRSSESHPKEIKTQRHGGVENMSCLAPRAKEHGPEICRGCKEPPAEITQFITVHHSSISSDPHGSVLVSAHDDGSVHLFRCWGCPDSAVPQSTGRAYQLLPKRRKAALRVAWNPYTQHMIAGGRDADIRIWDLNAERLVTAVAHGNRHCISALAESSRDNQHSSPLVFFGTAHGCVQLLDERVGGVMWKQSDEMRAALHNSSVVSLWADSNSSYVSSVDDSGRLIHWDIRHHGSPVNQPFDVIPRKHPENMCVNKPVFDVSPTMESFGPHNEFLTAYATAAKGQSDGAEIAITREPEGTIFRSNAITSNGSNSGVPYAMSLLPFRKQRTLCMLLQESDSARLVVYEMW